VRQHRVAFYCHNYYGLGHTSLSFAIIDQLLARGVHCAIITGCGHLSALQIPNGLEVATLTPITMDALGRPRPCAGDPDQGDVTRRRSAQILRFCRSWKPDCLVVDHHPLGLTGELVETLTSADLREVQMVWGISYPEGLLTSMYGNPTLKTALERYAHAMVYTDPRLDPVLNSINPDLLPGHVEYVGFVTKPVHRSSVAPDGEVVALCGGGYGSDSFHHLIMNVIDSFPGVPFKIAVGPMSDRNTVLELTARRGIQVLQNVPVEVAIDGAGLVISRCGYNTATYLLQTDLPVIFIPRQLWHDDQPRRASLLSKLTNIWFVDEHGATASDDLHQALSAARSARPGRRGHGTLAFDGAARAAGYLQSVAARS